MSSMMKAIAAVTKPGGLKSMVKQMAPEYATKLVEILKLNYKGEIPEGSICVASLTAASENKPSLIFLQIFTPDNQTLRGDAYNLTDLLDSVIPEKIS